MTEERTIVEGLNQFLRNRDRRAFLKLVGLGTAVAAVPAVLAGCEDPVDKTKEDDINLSSAGGPPSWMYALLQLNADFVARVNANKYPGITTTENTMFSNLNSAWTAQRNLLQSTITSGRVTDAILFDFSTVDFSNRTSVLDLTADLVDLMTSAVNGVASKISNANYALLMAKIHSVSGRIATYVRAVMNGDTTAITSTSFASSITASTGLDATVTPADAYTQTDPYFRTVLNISGI